VQGPSLYFGSPTRSPNFFSYALPIAVKYTASGYMCIYPFVVRRLPFGIAIVIDTARGLQLLIKVESPK